MFSSFISVSERAIPNSSHLRCTATNLRTAFMVSSFIHCEPLFPSISSLVIGTDSLLSVLLVSPAEVSDVVSDVSCCSFSSVSALLYALCISEIYTPFLISIPSTVIRLPLSQPQSDAARTTANTAAAALFKLVLILRPPYRLSGCPLINLTDISVFFLSQRFIVYSSVLSASTVTPNPSTAIVTEGGI